MLSSLQRRDRQPELMDDPRLDPAEHRRALAGLARINHVSRAVAGVWRLVREYALERRRAIRILDVATGSGDLPLALWQRAKRAGLPMEFAGCDISPTAVATAREQAKHLAAPVTFFEHDVLRVDLPDGYDVVICSLFLHHLHEDDATRLLQQMSRATRGIIIVSDLDRTKWNYAMVWLACHVLTRSRVVRYDGPTSVRAAFTRTEALALAERAGLHGTNVTRQFPGRFLLTWRKP